MKKVTIILLMGIYSLAGIGISVNSFYCCGQLKSVTLSLVGQKEPNCSGGPAGACCKLKHQTLKAQDNHTAPLIAFQFSHFTDLAIPRFPSNELQPLAGDDRIGVHMPHGPPLIVFYPLYIFHCDYRI